MAPLALLFLIIVVAIYYFKFHKNFSKTAPESDEARPSEELLPKQEKSNDKLVLVGNISRAEITQIINAFCNLYNKKDFAALPRLYEIAEKQFAVTFPFDIDFETYCFFVNFAHYPTGFDKSIDVIAWTTSNHGETWITEKSANKKVMLFIPADDKDYDNVYLTTNDNIGYKLGFAYGDEKQLLAVPKMEYLEPRIELKSLVGKRFEDFR
jgi:hypothetical protein